LIKTPKFHLQLQVQIWVQIFITRLNYLSLLKHKTLETRPPPSHMIQTLNYTFPLTVTFVVLLHHTQS